MTIISTTMSLSKPLKREPSIAGKRPSPKTGLPATSVATSSRGYIIKDEHTNTSAQDTQWLAFNIQRPIFADRRVRQAITPRSISNG